MADLFPALFLCFFGGVLAGLAFVFARPARPPEAERKAEDAE